MSVFFFLRGWGVNIHIYIFTRCRDCRRPIETKSLAWASFGSVGKWKNPSNSGFPLYESCGSSGSRFSCVWKALGCAWKVRRGSIRRILRVWKALGGSFCRILYAARRPADPINSCPCFTLRRFLPRASYLKISFCAPFGALRLSARLIPNRKRRALGAIVLSRISYLIPNRWPYPETMIVWGAYFWPCLTLPLHISGALFFACPKGALRLSTRPIGGGC